MKHADRIRIRPFFAYDSVDGKILPPKLSIEINGEVFPLRSMIEIEGKIVERREALPDPIGRDPGLAEKKGTLRGGVFRLI